MVLAAGMVGILGLSVRESHAWLTHADDWHRQYWLQRIGFALVTLVDVPLIQLVLAGVALLAKRPQRVAGDKLQLISSASPEQSADPSSPAP